MKLLYKPQQAVIKLFNDYSSNASEVKQSKIWRRTENIKP